MVPGQCRPDDGYQFVPGPGFPVSLNGIGYLSDSSWTVNVVFDCVCISLHLVNLSGVARWL